MGSEQCLLEGSRSITPAPASPALLELPQLELRRQLPGHGPQRQERGCDLGEEEGQEQAVHGCLQRQAHDVAVRQQEEQEGELDQEGEEEEPGQLGHLWEQRPPVGWGDLLPQGFPASVTAAIGTWIPGMSLLCLDVVRCCWAQCWSIIHTVQGHSRTASDFPLSSVPGFYLAPVISPSRAGLQEQDDRHSGPGQGDIWHSHPSPGRAVPHRALGT